MTDNALSLDASQEARIIVLDSRLTRLKERNDDLEQRVRQLEKRVFQAAAVGAFSLAILGLLAQISKAYL
tara:strand:+ start:2744 stop:2953 length:210 start_codon:yes stop_codon:yes gene_type:complete